MPKAVGRPTDCNAPITEKLCERIASGHSLKSICKGTTMPSESTVRNWLARGSAGDEPYVTFLRQYARAREDQADTDADEITDIGRRTLKGEVDPQAARVAIDALKWSAAKRAPKKYGEKVAHVGGDDGDPPLKAELTVKFVRS